MSPLSPHAPPSGTFHNTPGFSVVSSVVGAGRIKGIRSNIESHTAFIRAYLLAAWSLAWDPRNRSRSVVFLLFVAFLSTIVLTKRDVSLWGRTSLDETDEKPSIDTPIQQQQNQTSASLSDLTPTQKQSLLTSLYGSWNFYDGSAEDRPTEPYMTVENAGNPYLDLAEEKFPEDSSRQRGHDCRQPARHADAADRGQRCPRASVDAGSVPAGRGVDDCRRLRPTWTC